MKIAIIGYGKMGKAIEKMALQKGHTIVLKITGKNVGEMTSENLQKADVAIEFSGPAAAFENIKICMDSGLPVGCGST
nr:NAD(P)-binding domain-containing protein [Chitinophagaceae bacterium]